MQGLRSALANGNCILDLAASDIDGIIEESVDFLVGKERITTDLRDRVVDGLKQREKDAPTTIGHACCVPHYYDDDIEEPSIVFIRLKRAVNMGALDGIAIRFIFVLVGPHRHAESHLETLASIARLMSDDEFHYEATHAGSAAVLEEAIEHHIARSARIEKAPKPVDDAPLPKGFAAGLRADISKRLPHFVDEFKAGLNAKSAASIVFLFFACLAPAVTFGGLMGSYTGGQIGVVEMLVATAICGVLYSLFSGQPLIILGGIGPLLIFTAILYDLCKAPLGQEENFLAVYGWVGLWTGLFTVLLSVTNASSLMRHFTRFTDEIFSALMSLIFIYAAIRAIVEIFHTSFSDPEATHDGAFLTLILALGTFYIAMSLAGFRRSHYLTSWMREFLADFGPSIALVMMGAVAFLLRDEVSIATLQAGKGGEEEARSWLVNLTTIPMWLRLACALPAMLATVLIFLSQNITARLVNSPQNKLSDRDTYHLDLSVVGLLIVGCSFFGLPWLVAATVRSLAHVRALADTEEKAVGGATQEHIVHVNQNRFTALVIHLLIGLALLALPLLEYVPMATLYGVFLYMGFMSLRGVQFVERLSLWLMDSKLYPATHYIRRVKRRTIHMFTLTQLVALAILCAVNLSPWQPARILFPLFIALLIPFRSLVGRMFDPADLAILDADEEPEEEESHWV